jgi:hypothetical protein
MLSNRPPQPIQLSEANFRRLVVGLPITLDVYGQRVEVIAKLSTRAIISAIADAARALPEPPPTPPTPPDPPQAYEFLPRRRRKVPQ